jgi:tetratricopeptide (TPR) repeat protein
MRIQRSRARSAALALALCSGAATASAQERDELSRAERDQLARVHFRAGSRYFDLRRYAEAATEFERVFELSGQRGLLYNAARAWEAAGQARNAVRAYERFLAGDTAGIDRSRVQANINALSERARAEEQAAAQRAAAGCPEPPTSVVAATPAVAPAASSTAAGPLLQLQTRTTYAHRPLDASAPWVLLGLAGLTGGITVWQAGAYAIDASRVQNARVWSESLTGAQETAVDESRNAILAGSATGVFAVAGALWFALRGRGEQREEVVRTAWVAPTLNGGAIGGSF